MSIDVSVFVLTKNEAAGIAHCLAALQPFCEVVVIDSLSTDETASIARSLGVDVVAFDWDGKYPKKKQWVLDNVPSKSNWILHLDADETPTPGFLEELSRRADEMSRGAYTAYDIPLAYVFEGTKLKHGHTVVKRALVDRRNVQFPEVDDLSAPGIGELEGHYQPVAHGPVGRFDSRILHDDKDPIRTWFDRHNKYSDWEAHLRSRPSARSQIANFRSRQGQLFDRVPGKPLLFFLYAYIARLGFLDGRAGFDYALALSMYYWQIAIKVREARRTAEAHS